MSTKTEKSKRFEKQRLVKILTLLLLGISTIIQLLGLILNELINSDVVIWIGFIINLIILAMWLVFNLKAYKLGISIDIEKKY